MNNKAQCRFPHSARIVQKKDFARLLKGHDTHRMNCGPLRVYSQSCQNPGSLLELGGSLLGLRGPRLGLIVAKRVLPRAVDRNLAKRKIRESFRLAQNRLGNRDIVVQVLRFKDLDKLSAQLDIAWTKLAGLEKPGD